jgi:hypothetical protein
MADPTTDEEWAFQEALPRSQTPEQDGSDLAIAGIEGTHVRISDGKRSALYEQLEGEPLDLSKAEIVPAYVEAGWFTEANCVTLTDGEYTAVFVPVAGQTLPNPIPMPF